MKRKVSSVYSQEVPPRSPLVTRTLPFIDLSLLTVRLLPFSLGRRRPSERPRRTLTLSGLTDCPMLAAAPWTAARKAYIIALEPTNADDDSRAPRGGERFPPHSDCSPCSSSTCANIAFFNGFWRSGANRAEQKVYSYRILVANPCAPVKKELNACTQTEFFAFFSDSGRVGRRASSESLAFPSLDVRWASVESSLPALGKKKSRVARSRRGQNSGGRASKGGKGGEEVAERASELRSFLRRWSPHKNFAPSSSSRRPPQTRASSFERLPICQRLFLHRRHLILSPSSISFVDNTLERRKNLLSGRWRRMNEGDTGTFA